MSTLGSLSEDKQVESKPSWEKLMSTFITKCDENLKKVGSESSVEPTRQPGSEITYNGLSGVSCQKPVWRLNSNSLSDLGIPLKCQFLGKKRKLGDGFDNRNVDSCEQSEGEASRICKSPNINTGVLPVGEPKSEVRPDAVYLKVRNLEEMQKNQTVPVHSDVSISKQPMSMPSRTNKCKTFGGHGQLSNGIIPDVCPDLCSSKRLMLPLNGQSQAEVTCEVSKVNFCEQMVDLPNQTIKSNATNGDICEQSVSVRDSVDVPSICCGEPVRDSIDVPIVCCGKPVRDSVDVPSICCGEPVRDSVDVPSICCGEPVRESVDVPSICCGEPVRDSVDVPSICCGEPVRDSVDVPNSSCVQPVRVLSNSEVISGLPPVKRRKLQVEEQSRIAEPKDNNLPKNCEQQIVCSIGKTVLDIHNDFLSAGNEPIECWEDICELSDGKYESFFNISRITMRKLLDFVKDIDYDSLPYQNILSHMSIDQLISFSVRYLAKSRNTVEDSFRLFNVPPGRANYVLEKGFHLIAKLRDVVIKKPDITMWQETRNYNLAQYQIASAGALGHHIFVTEKEEVLLAQVICNEKSMFAVVDVGSDLRISAALEKSNILQDAINSLPDNCYLIASYEYKSYMQSALKILTPLIETDDWQLQDYNEALCKTHTVLHCFEETCKIFPRLNCLHRALPEAVVSALVLYNLSILCKDLS